MLLLCLIIAAINGNFLSLSNFVRLLSSAAIPMVLVMGATFVILMGSIDLSVEGVVALTAVIVSLLVLNDFSGLDVGFFAVPVAIFVGGAHRFYDGVIHVRLRIPSFMTTLGLGFACVGIATAILGGYTVRISDRGFRDLTLGRFLDVPFSVWLAATAVIIAWVIQERTRIGRWVYAIGTDEVIARQVGVPVERTRIIVFTIAGLFYGLAGAMSASQLGQGHGADQPGPPVTTITAVVVGGTALSGGVGSVLNSVIGVLIVVVLTNGMVLMGIPPFVQLGVQGILIIIAVALALDRTRLEVVK